MLRDSFEKTSRDDGSDDDDLNNDFDIMREQMHILTAENNKLKGQLE